MLLGCDASSARQAPPPVLTLPPQLSSYHVFVADLLTGDVAEVGVRTIHAAESVHGLGLSTDGQTLFVTDIAGNRLLGYSLNSGTLGAEQSVGVGIEPVHMVETPDGKTIYVTDFGATTISVVNAATWTLRSTIVVPTSETPNHAACTPHSIEISPDGRWVYAACFGGSSIAVINAANATLFKVVPLPANSVPYGLAVSSDGRALYASDDFSGRLYVIDTTTFQFEPTLTVGRGPALIARSPDGKMIYVSDGGSASVSPVNISPDPLHPTVLPAVAVDGTPHGIAVTPDGRYVVVANQYADNLAVIDASTLKVVATIHGEKDPINVLITR